MSKPFIAFAAVGAAHPHVHGQVNALLDAGAHFKWFYDADPAVCATMASQYNVPIARQLDEIFADNDVRLVVGTPIPDERSALGITVMQHGRDYLCAKPGFTTLEQLTHVRRVQQETKRIYSVYFGERFGNPATVHAGELVRSGRIGKVIQVVGFGPHRLLGHIPRPPWAFERTRTGGIINDLACHQIDQFLWFTGSAEAEIVSAQIGTAKFHQFPDFEDFGDVHLRSPQATGYLRVDWLTPAGLPTWGDVRLFLTGTDGTIEVRKTIDPAGKPGTNHVIVVDGTGVEHITCEGGDLPFARQLLTDIEHRTETAMSQSHCFLTCDLALQAQAKATTLPFAPAPLVTASTFE